MKIFYHCYGAAHSSVVAAFLHLGRLPAQPTARDLQELPYFDRQEKSQHGHIYFLGTAAEGDEIYIFGRRNLPQVAVRVLTGMSHIFNLPPEEHLFVNSSSAVNWLMVLGGILSRELGLVWPGRWLVTSGTRRALPKLKALVAQVKNVAQKARDQARSHLNPELLPNEKRPGETGQPRGHGSPGFIFYQCYGSTHSSVVSAAIHLGLLPSTRRPRAKELLALPLFDQVPNDQVGHPFFLGRDEAGRQIYAIGLDGQPFLLKRLVADFLKLHGLDPEVYRFYDALSQAGFLVRLGGFLSRRLGLVTLGRPLTILGIQMNYPRFVQLVKRVKKELQEKDDPPLAPPDLRERFIDSVGGRRQQEEVDEEVIIVDNKSSR